MRLDDVMDEVAKACHTITGLRIVAWPAASVSAPGGYVSYPTTVDYDQTYAGGVDTLNDLMITLIAGDVTAKASRDQVARWASGDGPESLPAALARWDWQTCDDVQVTSCEFNGETIAGILYLAADFKATVNGPGRI